MSKFLALFQYHYQLHWPTSPHAKGACPHTQKNNLSSVPDPSCKFINDIANTDITRHYMENVVAITLFDSRKQKSTTEMQTFIQALYSYPSVTLTHLNIAGNVVLRYTITRVSCPFHSPSHSLQLSLAYVVTNSSTSGYREVQMFWKTCCLHLCSGIFYLKDASSMS
jgi:hypothetical protein